MKYAKMLGLAVTAAMALMAFLGAGSASATVLCKTAMTEGCAASGWNYPVGTVIDLSLEGSTSTRATSGTEADTCTEGTIKGSTTNVGSSTETVDWNIAEMWSANCTETTHGLTLGSLEVHWIEGTTNGTVTVRGTTATKGIFGTSCTYGQGGGVADLGVLVGGEAPTLSVEALFTKLQGGFLCPGDVIWKGAYKVTSPQPLYVSKS